MKQKIPPAVVAQFRDYCEAAEAAAEDLAFTMEHLDTTVAVDYSLASLQALDAMIWTFHQRRNFPEELFPFEDFIHLVSQYTGSAVVHQTGGAWSQGDKRQGFMPCIDGFGNSPAERVFPPRLAEMQMIRLAKGNPSPVFAPALADALAIHAKTKP